MIRFINTALDIRPYFWDGGLKWLAIILLVFLGLVISANLDLFLRVVFRIFWIAGNLRHGWMGWGNVASFRGKNVRWELLCSRNVFGIGWYGTWVCIYINMIHICHIYIHNIYIYIWIYCSIIDLDIICHVETIFCWAELITNRSEHWIKMYPRKYPWLGIFKVKP